MTLYYIKGKVKKAFPFLLRIKFRRIFMSDDMFDFEIKYNTIKQLQKELYDLKIENDKLKKEIEKLNKNYKIN